MKPSLSISLRRIRTQAEWKVETHMIRARRPTSASTRSFISAAALLVKVIARIEPGCALALGDQPGDAAGQHPGLAGAGAGDDEQRRALVDDRRALGLVEPVEQVVARRLARTLGLGLVGAAEGLADDGEGVAHLRSSLRVGTPRRPGRSERVGHHDVADGEREDSQ